MDKATYSAALFALHSKACKSDCERKRWAIWITQIVTFCWHSDMPIEEARARIMQCVAKRV